MKKVGERGGLGEESVSSFLAKVPRPRIFFFSLALFVFHSSQDQSPSDRLDRTACLLSTSANKQTVLLCFFFTEIPNFLMSEECDYVIKLAEENGLISSIARGGLTTKKDLEVPVVESMWLKAGVNMKAVF